MHLPNSAYVNLPLTFQQQDCIIKLTLDLIDDYISNMVKELQFNKTAKCDKSNNNLEFALPNLFAFKGIIHYRNTSAKWQCSTCHKHFLNVRGALAFQAKASKNVLVTQCPSCSVPYKRILSQVLHNKSSYEHLYGTYPDLRTLWVLGSLSYYSMLQPHRSKFDTQARKGIF